MRRIFALILALSLLACGVSALTEESSVNCLIEEGSFIIQIDDPEGDLGWVADDMAQDDSVVKLYDADLIEDTFVVRYDPVGDGDVTVGVRHFTGIACDEAHTFDLHVENGAVTESTGGSYTASPDEAEQDPFLSGEWLERETQFTQMTVEKNQARGWDVEVVSPMTHGAYIFKATVYYDCELDTFVYDKGKFWDVPITDSEEAPELGEAKLAGCTGSFTLGGDSVEGATLTWYSDVAPEESVVFERADATAIDYGASELYTQDDLDEAVDLIKASFLGEDGCVIHAIRYAGDENNTEENLAWLNGHPVAEGKTYAQCAEFLVDFHSPVDESYQGALDLDTEYQDYNFWFAREEGGSWELVDLGY